MKKIILFLAIVIFVTSIVNNAQAYSWRLNSKNPSGTFTTYAYGKKTQLWLRAFMYGLTHDGITVVGGDFYKGKSRFFIFYGPKNHPNKIERISIYRNYTDVYVDNKLVQKLPFYSSGLFVPSGENPNSPIFIKPNSQVKKLNKGDTKRYFFLSGGVIYELKLAKRADMIVLTAADFKNKKIHSSHPVVLIGQGRTEPVILITGTGSRSLLCGEHMKCVIYHRH